MSATDNFNLRDFIRTERARDRGGRIHHFVKYLPDNHQNQQLITVVSGGVSVMRADGRLYERSDCMGDLVSVVEREEVTA